MPEAIQESAIIAQIDEVEEIAQNEAILEIETAVEIVAVDEISAEEIELEMEATEMESMDEFETELEVEAAYEPIFTAEPTSSEPTFADLGVAPGLVRQLNEAGITVPTPIQKAAIPIAVTGRDLIGIAQTGTGKTLAFALPMVTRFSENDRGVVLAPTRELAEQIAVGLQKIGMHPALLIGGAPMGRQISQLRGRCNLIVATPGRLMDHLMQGTVGLGSVSTVVLDEADRMLDMGFAPIIRQILSMTPETRQTLLFSATMPKEIEDLALSHMRNPARVEIAPQGTASELVEQEIAYVGHDDKRGVLEQLLIDVKGPTLVFTRTRHGARKLAVIVREMGHHAGELHSDRTLAQRQSAMEGFRSGYHRVLVATDIAARGIDVKNIELIVNWDVPEHAEDYVHRIGRTGRAGSTGRAVTLVLREQAREVRDIERLLDSQIPISDLSTVATPVFHAPRQNGSRGNNGATPNRRQRRQDRPGNERPSEVHAPNSFSANIDRMPAREEAPRPAREYGNNRPQDSRTPDVRPQGDRPQNDRPYGARPYGNHQSDQRPSGDWRSQNNGGQPARPYQDRNSQDRPNTDRTNADRPYQDRNSMDRPRNDRPYQGGSSYQGNNQSRPYQGGNNQGGSGYQGNQDRPRQDRPYQGGSGYQGNNQSRPYQGGNNQGGPARSWGDRNDAPRADFPGASGAPRRETRVTGTPRPRPAAGTPSTNSGATPPKKAHRGWSGKPNPGR